MIEWFFTKLARFLARPNVFAWLFEKAVGTPYLHLKRDAETLYMARFWLFNPYRDNELKVRRWPLPLSIRIHFIAGPDDMTEHDHPWSARTFILKGWYAEERSGVPYMRFTGTTATLKFGEFHRIAAVSPRGCWTLFVMYRKRGDLGFKG